MARYRPRRSNRRRGVARTRWEEVEFLSARAVVFAEVLLQVAPRRNHAIEAGPQAISRDRLTVHAGRAAQPGGETIHAALDAALRLSQPDPQFLALADLADQLARHADSDEPTAA